MTKKTSRAYFPYWGKAKKLEEGGYKSHPICLHSLDVAAVASEWWNGSAAIRRSFSHETALSEKKAKALAQFFIALHDFGKIDARFQNKAPEISPCKQAQAEAGRYDHGGGGYMWFVSEGGNIFKGCSGERQRALQDWLAQTAGHHGSIPFNSDPNPLPSYAPSEIKEQDRLAREQFARDMAEIFLETERIKLDEPGFPEKPPLLLAGFCAVCDWIGSNTDYFPYTEKKDSQKDLSLWLESRKPAARKALRQFGLLTKIISSPSEGMERVYPDLQPRNIQKLIDKLEAVPSLVIIEASTGSGKTEAAIAFASRLLAKGFADSIAFALPTQATANAILPRLEKAAEKIFSQGRNIILAHGKSPYNENFKKLIERSSAQTGAEGNKAGAQCAEWLALSRKRAFLGQAAVTTVDQAMLSAIKPLKHYFIRSFGIGKSALIIDEIHAYDSYMYGILEKVIQNQRRAGGSALLLSATLPWNQKQRLLKAWEPEISEEKRYKSQYPMILQITNKGYKGFAGLSGGLSGHQRQTGAAGGEKAFQARALFLESPEKSKTARIQLWPDNEMAADENKLRETAKAAAKAKIGLVCNLVDDAQAAAQKLKAMGAPVDVFHSRCRYKDRMKKEGSIIKKYGKHREEGGSILIATQVVEQSLDIDFDWLISFLCPADLMFQRMGRLHRHLRERPKGFEKPLFSVILPRRDQWDYKRHKYIYHNKRALWRTQQLLCQMKTDYVVFPAAYRGWIEKVYQEEPWKDEPPEITEAFEKYKQDAEASLFSAKSLFSENAFYNDTDGNAAFLTREGEMNLTVIPFYKSRGKFFFLDGEETPPSDSKNWESLYQNGVPVPCSWGRFLPQAPDSLPKQGKGSYWLQMEGAGEKGKWQSEAFRGIRFHYTAEYGLKKESLAANGSK